jgi:hypothetical protein
MVHPDPTVREHAADAWCTWEDAAIAHETQGNPGRYSAKPDAAKLAFVRICTHYFAHHGWLDDGQLLRDAHRLRGIPGTLIHGSLDLSAPLLTAWELAQMCPTPHSWRSTTPDTPGVPPLEPQSNTRQYDSPTSFREATPFYSPTIAPAPQLSAPQ